MLVNHEVCMLMTTLKISSLIVGTRLLKILLNAM